MPHYISQSSYKEALLSLSKTPFDNAFLGLLFVFKAVTDSAITTNTKIKFDADQVTIDLNEMFSFSAPSIDSVNKEEYFILSENFIDLVADSYLHNKKLDLLSLAIVTQYTTDFSTDSEEQVITSFKELFKLNDECIEKWFENSTDNYNISFQENKITQDELSLVLGTEFFQANGDKIAISFDRKANAAKICDGSLGYIKNKAGAWGASGYIQKFKPTTSAAEIIAVIHSELLNKYIEHNIAHTDNVIDHKDAILGSNEIYYGAPGTGKSYTIDKIVSGYNKVVTVFHPDTQYSDFVGSLKPKMEIDKSSDKKIVTYQFRAGPFTEALIQALNTPEKHVYLVIEEINRAPAAAVFGELFQLLDRENGRSKYSINISDPDMLEYINIKVNKEEPISKLFIPSNLSLVATMNSSDQAVMPMDTAFKRRWNFKYIEIDFTLDSVPKTILKLMTSDGLYEITWPVFAQIINNALINCSVPEDRLLGPFFLSPEEMQDETTAEKSLGEKLFIYIWDDVLRHYGHEKIFSSTYKTFGKLSNAFNNDKEIFNAIIDDEIKNQGAKVESEKEIQ